VSAQWHYAIGEKEFGPVSSQELKRLATSGQLKPEHQVWREGMADWVTAGSIKNLCPARSAAPDATTPAAAPNPAASVPESAGSDDYEVEPPKQRPAEAPSPAGQQSAAAQAPADATAASSARAEHTASATGSAGGKSAAKSESRQGSKSRSEDPFELGDQVSRATKEASQDALAAFVTMLRNPVGGLPTAFEQLGPTRAMAAGIVFCVVFAASFFIGVQLLGTTFVTALLAMSNQGGAIAFVKVFLLSLLSPIGIVAGCAATRAMFHGEEGYQSDLFIGGAALLPLAVFLLLAGLLQSGNAGVVLTLLIFAMCTTVLMLYSGSTRLHRVPEAAATIAVPIILVLCIWITKIIAVALQA